MMNEKQYIPAGYKLSPLGPIPEDWKVKRLGEIGDFSKGNGVPKDKIIKDEHGHPCLTYGDLYTKYDFVIKNIKSFIDDVVASESKEIHIGDICFAGSGETPEDIGKCAAYIEEKTAYAGGDIIILSPNKDIDSIWLSYVLNSDIGGKQRYKSAQGFSIVHIYPDNLKRIQIPTLSLKEQHSIVSVLQLWDTAIAKQAQLVEKLTLRKRGLMQQLLTGKKRLKGFSGEWKEVRLGEICPMERGEMLTSDNYKEGDIPVIAGGKEPAGFHNTANRHSNSITVSCSGASAGYVAFYKNPIFATDCFTISESDDYNVLFIFYILFLYQEQIYKLQSGGAQPHVHPKDLYPMKVILPSIKEQNAIASVLVDADKEIELVNKKLARLQEEKKGLMQVLLTGKKRINKQLNK